MTATPRFQRTREDFVCAECGTRVRGNGYTDHCPKCLWGKHVDVNPGDRLSDCGGMLEPVAAHSDGGGYVITYQCVRCGATKRNKAALDDDFEAMVALSGRPS